MNHEKIKNLLSAYFDGETTPEEKEIVEEHLINCVSCQKYIAQISQISSSLKSVSEETPSPDLEQKIQRFLKREGQTMKSSRKLVGIGSSLIVIFFLAVMVNHNVKKMSEMSLVHKIKDTSQYLQKTSPQSSPLPLGETSRYEPYYLSTDYSKDKNVDGQLSKNEKIVLGIRAATTVSKAKKEEPKRTEMRLRAIGGYQESGIINVESSYWGGPPTKKICSLAPSHSDVITDEAKSGTPFAEFNTEQYDRIYENEFLSVKDNALSTFSIDVDTASYSNIRRFLNAGQMPPKDSVRIEEMINYFVYDYPQPKGSDPFSINMEVAPAPWKPEHQLALIGIQGKELKSENLPPSNLVFLIDVSGSMDDPNKLPLLKSAFRLMVNQLRAEEKIAIVTYAGNAGLVLDSTPGSEKEKILQAIDNLSAGGSTAGGAGIRFAYEIAQKNFIKGGNNRVILATDGDFNVGVSSDGELTRIIEEKRKEGVFLTVLGFGTGNYKDSKMEKLADKGNGNYYYIDTQNEARKVLVRELGSTLFTIAKDVKIQIEFNPTQVKAYRLIGYENRILAKEDFNDDTKDAGELGAGHTVTAFYELIPADSSEDIKKTDELKYQKQNVIESSDLMTVKLRYKKPNEEKSQLITETVSKNEIKKENTSNNFQFASSVAEFGLLLRDSQFKGYATYPDVLNRAQKAKGNDEWGYRQEFIDLVGKARDLAPVNSDKYNFKGQKEEAK